MTDTLNIVRGIIDRVRKDGDRALCDMAKRFDKVTLSPKSLRVTSTELAAARKKVSPAFLKALKESAKSVEAFAIQERKRLTRDWTIRQGSARLGQLVRPVESAGLYIPGGRFPYPSTVLMTSIPARVAGVKRLVMASPPKNLTPEVLTAAAYAGIQEIYRMGGAGAIAAMAYGTKTIAKVDLIVGPGNQFVTEAKRQVFGQVGIDSLAGPSEVVIIADKSTPDLFITTDLQAQAEHDPEAQAVLLSTDAELLSRIRRSLDPRIAARVRLQKVRTIDEAIEEANKIAPEHFELLIPGAEKYLPKIKHAGAIFLGPGSPAAMGDYVAGPSHVLPTSGSAHFSSGLSVATFMKRSSVIGFQANSSERSRWEAALTFAATEGMEYHGASLRCRVSR